MKVGNFCLGQGMSIMSFTSQIVKTTTLSRLTQSLRNRRHCNLSSFSIMDTSLEGSNDKLIKCATLPPWEGAVLNGNMSLSPLHTLPFCSPDEIIIGLEAHGGTSAKLHQAH